MRPGSCLFHSLSISFKLEKEEIVEMNPADRTFKILWKKQFGKRFGIPNIVDKKKWLLYSRHEIGIINPMRTWIFITVKHLDVGMNDATFS